MVRRRHSRHYTQEHREASAATSRGECVRRNATENSAQKWCQGKYGLLTGAFAWVIFLYHPGSKTNFFLSLFVYFFKYNRPNLQRGSRLPSGALRKFYSIHSQSLLKASAASWLFTEWLCCCECAYSPSICRPLLLSTTWKASPMFLVSRQTLKGGEG